MLLDCVTSVLIGSDTQELNTVRATVINNSVFIFISYYNAFGQVYVVDECILASFL